MEGTRGEPRRTKPPRRTTSVGSEDETEFVEEESLLEYVRSIFLIEMQKENVQVY